MLYILVFIYVRVLLGNKLFYVVVGDYENKLLIKIMKGILYVFIVGLVYGFMWVIEYYCNVMFKVDEFCVNVGNIYNYFVDVVCDE